MGEKRCQYHIAPIMKAANYRLKDKYPEAHEFFKGFTMGTRQVNKVVSIYLDQYVNNNSLGATEKWLKTACTWLKSNDPGAIATWNVSAWLVDVQRYDCLSGCGFTDAEGAYTDLGGTCDFYTGQCVCDREELFSDLHCQGSCPGLVGPFLTDDGDYDFYYCSNHGTCDTTTRQCTYLLGYGDAGCGTEYSAYRLDIGLQIIIILLSGILTIICIACIVWLRMNRQYKTVKALSVDMTTLMTIGLAMIVCSNIASAQKATSVTCIAWQWLFGLGGILSIMSPLLKAYRVSRVYHGGKMLRAVKITDKMLMATLIKCAVIEIAVCIGYSVLHEVYGGTHIYYNHEELRSEIKCNDSQITAYLSMGSYAYFFVVLCILTYYSWGTRRALSVFKESTCAYFSSFLSLLCTLITFVFYMATEDPAFRVAVQAFAIIIVISCVLVLFYAQRIYQFYQQPQNRNVTDARGASSHVSQKSSSASSVMKPGPNANA